MFKSKSSKRITQRDVAKAANVSQTTVSQVLKNTVSAKISSEHRQRVLEAAEKLGYQKRTNVELRGEKQTLAYIHPVVTRGHHQEEWIYRSYEDFYNRKRTVLEEAAQAAGFMLMSRGVTEGDESLTQWLSEWDIKGVFWHCSDPGLGQWVRARLPVVQFDRSLLKDTDVVMANASQTIEVAMDHLMNKGHRKIAFISNHNSNLRRRAYLHFVEDAGLPCYDYTEEFSGGAGLEKVPSLFCRPSPAAPTALIAPDHYVLRIQKRLLQEGASLPDDLSMVGIDNISACAFGRPALTSVDPASDEAAEDAVALMEARLRNPGRGCRMMEISPRLVERESVKTLNARVEDSSRTSC